MAIGFVMSKDDERLTRLINSASTVREWDKVPHIKYQPDSGNRLAFHHYDPDDAEMKNALRFSVVYWHTFRNRLSDPFGAGTACRPWDDGSESIENAKNRARVAMRVVNRLRAPFYAFHDRDIAPEKGTLLQTNKALDAVVDVLAVEQEAQSVKPLWGTACLFGHPRYAMGAATSPDPDVFAFAGAQVKKAIEITHRLGGKGYVFWGGREGYTTLLNTDMKREMDHLAKFLYMAVNLKNEIEFDGDFYIEPKPKEPTKHQYDFDVAACLNFLGHYNLLREFKLNVETNHATLAGHTVQHELRTAWVANALGSIDANAGDSLLGWDTDHFPLDHRLTTYIMMEILAMGGFTNGGTNFDAKVRRESWEPIDLFHAHISGMDHFAVGWKAAKYLADTGQLRRFVASRYAGFDTGWGMAIETDRTMSLADLETHALSLGRVKIPRSGREEMLEGYVSDAIAHVLKR